MTYGSADSGYGAGASVFHTDASHADTVLIPDADLLFNGAYKRHGPDLVLTGHDGERHVVPGYFSGQHHPALVAPNGARLSADLVDLLAGSPAPNEYAQASSTTPANPIGKVEKVVGIVDVMRNGVSVTLHVGDAVYKGDIIETASDGSCGIGFPDGTALNIVANARMAINDYVFDPNSTSNAALFTLVEGTFAFVAGKVAHTGDMRIATPVATMGIRGTTGIIGTSTLGEVYFVLQDDYHTSRHGILEIIEFNIFINNTDTATYCSTSGCRTEPLNAAQVAEFQQLTEQLGQMLNQLNNPNPQSNPTPGSPTLPQFDVPHVLLENDGGTNGPITFVFQTPPGPTVYTVFVTGVNGSEGPQQGGPPPPHKPTSFVWNSNGPASWSQQPNDWSGNSPPTSSSDSATIQTGISNYDIPGAPTTIGFLTVDQGATLNVTNGELVASGLLDNGTINVTGDPPAFVINGPATIGSTGVITVSGTSDEGEFNGSVSNSGHMTASAGGELLFNDTVNNEPDSTRKLAGHIVSTGAGSTILFENDASNAGTIAARDGGAISFDGSTVTNEPADGDDIAGRIVSRGKGSAVDFNDVAVTNFGGIVAINHGGIAFDPSNLINFGTVKAEDRGTISFVGSIVGPLDKKDVTAVLSSGPVDLSNFGLLLATDGSIKVADASVDNASGTIQSKDDGAISFHNSIVINNADSNVVANSGAIWVNHSFLGNAGTIKAVDGGKIGFTDSYVVNRGEVLAKDEGSWIGVRDSTVVNSHHGLIEAKHGGVIDFDDATVINKHHGTIEAADYGTIVFCNASDLTNKGGSQIVAEDHSTVRFDDTSVSNDGGTIAALGRDAKVELADSFITGGTLKTGDGGVIETVYGSSVIDGATIACDSYVRVNNSTTLTLADGTTMWGGNLHIGCTGTVDIETCQGATLDGVAVWNKGTIQVDESDAMATLTLADSTTIHDGTLCIGCTGTVDIETCQGATLDGVAVWNKGTIQVDSEEGDGAPATLALEGGSTIHDGTLCIGCYGTVTIETCQGATLDGVAVWNKGTIQVDESDAMATLTLAGGTAIHDGTLYIDCTGTVDIETCQSATLDGVTVWNKGTIQLGDSATLTIDGTVDLNGQGVVNLVNGDEIVGGSSGDRLDNHNTISGVGTIGDGSGDLALTNDANGIIDANCGTFTIDTGASEIKNAGLLEATAFGVLDIQDVKINNTGTGSNGIFIDSTSELLVDTSTLKLVGNGDVTLETGSLIDGNGSDAPDTLDNVNNRITGAGTIGDGSGDLALTNDANGTIDANCSTLTIDTGASQVNNAGLLEATAFGVLDIQDVKINNTGTGSNGIFVDSTSELLVDTPTLKLIGGGNVTLDGGIIDGNGSDAPDTLDNVNNTIVGAGTIGDTSGDLALINEKNGVIDATGSLTIETGANAIINNGTFEATSSTGDLVVASALTGMGSVTIGNGAVVEFESTVSSHQTVTFSGGGYGELIVDDAPGFAGKIVGFTGTAADTPSLATTDEIDITDINFLSDSFSEHYNSMTGVLKISDGTTVAKLTFVDFTGTFQFATDGSNGTLIYDPPATNSASPSASFGADTFVFHPNADSGNNSASWDAGALNHAGWAHTQQEWSELAGDANGAAVAEFAQQHADSHWHYALHSAAHLH
jgi:FecR protein